MKPILFNTEMVRAILDGRKTVTRRVIHIPNCGYFMTEPPRVVSRYQTGDILYVRETFFREDCISDCGGRSDPDECPFNRVGNSCYGYKAQYTTTTGEIKWHPSIHMPKEAARIFLRVQDVHAERVQEITGAECVREGIPQESLKEVGEAFTVGQFADLWDSTVKPADLHCYGWDANPWVWVIDFERISRDEALKEDRQWTE